MLELRRGGLTHEVVDGAPLPASWGHPFERDS
jgi:hypothetical protein